MKDIINSLMKTFIVLVHSKRAWAVFTGMVMLVAKEFFPDQAGSIYAALALIGSWVLGESYRPAVEKKPTDSNMDKFYGM